MDDPRIRTFELRYAVKAVRQLGFGRDGRVVYTDRRTAVKFLDDSDSYRRERDVYVRLQELEVKSILGHRVPDLQWYDDELLAIEMTIVHRPFFLDFASAYPVDEAPDFSDEVWFAWREQLAEQFGDRWPEVERLVGEFESMLGVVLLDLNPGNITFAD